MLGVTVNEFLELLKGHGAILKAGGNSLSNVIETVSVLEVTDYQQWLRGGELFLSTLGALQTNEQVYKLIKDLIMVGTAALAIHPGIGMEVSVSDEAYRLAEENNFPIIILSRTIPYSTVYSVILDAMIKKQKDLLEQSKRINKYLIEIILTGGSFEKIALSLQKLIEKPVLIADNSFNTLAVLGADNYPVAGFTRQAMEILKQQTLQTIKNGARKEGILSIQTYYKTTLYNKAKLLMTKVAVGRDVYGYVVTLADTADDEETDFLKIALTHAATAVALEVSKHKSFKIIEERLNLEFLDDLLNGHYTNEDIIVQRAKQRGLDLKGKHAVIVIEIDRFDVGINPQEIWDQIYKTVKFSVMCRNKQNIVIPRDDCIVVIPHFSEEVKAEAIKTMLSYLSRELTEEIKRTVKSVTVSVGIGGYSMTPNGLAQSYYQAQQAVKIGRKIKGFGGVFDYEQLGVYSFLLSFGNEDLKENCRQYLAKVLDYDRATNGELIKTMEMYLDCNENISRTAEKLYVHPNTVKYRLDRIKEILGRDPFSNGEEKLYYHISTKAIKIL